MNSNSQSKDVIKRKVSVGAQKTIRNTKAHQASKTSKTSSKSQSKSKSQPKSKSKATLKSKKSVTSKSNKHSSIMTNQQSTSKAPKDQFVSSPERSKAIITDEDSIIDDKFRTIQSRQKSPSSHSKDKRSVKPKKVSEKSERNSSRSSSVASGRLPSQSKKLEQKLKTLDKDLLKREYRILYYKNRQVRQLLKEYFQANSDLVEQAEESKTMQADLAKKCKEYKFAFREQKEKNKFSLETIQRLQEEQKQMLRNQEKDQKKHQAIEQDYYQLKDEHNLLSGQFVLLNEQNEALQRKIESLEEQRSQFSHIMEGKNHAIRDRGNIQDQYYRSQKEAETYRDQLENLKEQNLHLKVQIEQQNVTIAEFEHQMVQMNEQVQNSIEEYDLQVSSLKGQVQAANQKLMQVEGQVSTQKFSEGNLHEQLQSAKDQITRFQEDQRIQSLKLENRERELQELKQKDIQSRKRIIDIESQLQLCQNKVVVQSEPTTTQKMMENTSSSKTILQKELATERLFHQKSQQEIQSLRRDVEYKEREIKDYENRYMAEQQDKLGLLKQLQSLQVQHEQQVLKLEDRILEMERGKYKESIGLESQSRNQELIITSQQARIQELEIEGQKALAEFRARENIIAQLQQRLLEKDNQHLHTEQRNTDYFQEIRNLRQEREEQIKLIHDQQNQLNEKQREIDQLEKLIENYKSKYLSSKYENRKIKSSFEEKENTLKNTYTNQVERIKQEKESLERHKREEESQRQMKDKKLKVISDIQKMIKHHKKEMD